MSTVADLTVCSRELPELTLEARWLSALDPAGGDDVALWCERSLEPLLAGWLPREPRPPFRLHLDVGGRCLGAVLDSQNRVVLLGSPRFELERRLHGLGLDEATTAPFARGWREAELHQTPLDIERATRAHQLVELHLNPPPDEMLPVLKLTEQLAYRLDERMRDYRPGWLERLSQWALSLQADYEVLRIHALRFVAMLPSLDHDTSGVVVTDAALETLRRIIEDDRPQAPLPKWIVRGAQTASWLLSRLPSRWVSDATRASVRTVAGIFIAGETIERAAEALEALHRSGRSATVDQLGELVVTESEADAYRDEVLANIRGLARQFGAKRTGANIPYAHVSVKTSALCAHYLADDPDGTWARVGPRLTAIFDLAQDLGVFVNLDAEHYSVRDLTLGMLERALASRPALWAWQDVGIVVQAYLTDAAAHLEAVIALAKRRGVMMPIRLVKGAYWDAETTEADAHGFDAPQWLNKCETDICFQQLTVQTLQHGQWLQLCVGSHNLRDHCFARAARTTLYPEAPEVEHQALHATYEALSEAMAKLGWSVRNYIPVGSLLVGMAYLVRRVMENASQVGVLTMARGGVLLPEVLQPPGATLQRLLPNVRRRPNLVDDAPWPLFTNHAPSRLYLPEHRAGLGDAIARDRLLKSLRATAASRGSGAALASVDPSAPDTVLHSLTTLTTEEVKAAVETAAAAPSATAAERCRALVLAAEDLAARRDDWAVLVAREAGKSRDEALADVDEAIDFFRFYADEAWRRAGQGRAARGVIAAVTPWNFPLAIPCGMVAAALATGNSVILKSAEQTPLTAEALVRLLHRCGVHEDALIHAPGDGPTVGAPLVQHPLVAGVLFTGSKAVGTLLHQQLAATTHQADDGATRGKVVVTEMGGKNAVIVTGSADLDEAIAGVLYSAFAHAGQKCSAASRVIVDQSVFNTFSDRLGRAARDLHLGAALTPGVQVNPVISAEDRDRLLAAQEAAKQECEDNDGLVLNAGGLESGQLVKPAVFSVPMARHADGASLSRQELFGPVVHVMPFGDDEEAVQAFNQTEYALTGGVFAQRQDEIDALSSRLRCGNLYINRSNTGARVAIEPFGGFLMSGTGPKAGNARYLEPLYAPLGEPAGPWPEPVETLPLGDASLSEAKALPVATATAEALNDACQSITSQPLKALTQALLNAWPAPLPPEVTRAIPGQITLNHTDIPRGPVSVLCGRVAPGPTGMLHAVAALRSGSPVTLIGSAESLNGWRPWVEAAHGLGVQGVQMCVVASLAEASGVAVQGSARAVVIDGPRAPWGEALTAALKERVSVECLPPVWCQNDGPDVTSSDAMMRAHHVVRTVATNTMRHGAPLELRGAE